MECFVLIACDSGMVVLCYRQVDQYQFVEHMLIVYIDEYLTL